MLEPIKTCNTTSIYFLQYYYYLLFCTFVGQTENNMSGNKSLIITVNEHPYLGSLLIPYWAREITEDVLEAEEKAVCVKDEQLPESERQIITLAQCYSEKNLMKAYSKELTVGAFLRSLSDSKKRKLVRAYIEKKHREIIELIHSASIPLYIRETATKQLYSHHRIQVCKELVEASFLFELNETLFRYSIQCQSAGQPLSLLKKKPLRVLCSLPAVIIAGHELFLFKRIEVQKLIPFTEKDYVQVPASESRKYMEKIVLPMMTHYPVSALGFQIGEEFRECTATLSVRSSISNRPILQLYFHYEEQIFSPGQRKQRCYPRLEEKDGRPIIRYYTRNSGWEQDCLSLLTQLGFTQINDSQFRRSGCTTEYSLTDWLNQNKDKLTSRFWFDKVDKANTYFVGEISLKQDIADTLDWFEIRTTVQIGSYTFPFIRFQKHIQESDRCFRLPDGQIALLPEEWFEKYNDLMHYGIEKEGFLRIRKIHIGVIEEIMNGSKQPAAREYVQKEYQAVPPRIQATLRPYQEDGYAWMLHLAANGFGGCLADDMGLGKTLQTITLLQQMYDSSTQETMKPALKEPPRPTPTADRFGQFSLFGEEEEEEGEADLHAPKTPIDTSPHIEHQQASLIVLPTSLLSNWKREIHRFSSLQVCEYSGEKCGKEPWKKFGHYQIVLTTYGLLRRDIDLLEKYTFNYVILDESQNIKNPDSQSYRSAIRLKSRNRLVLTGTPIENSLKDLWAQFNFINPGLLGTLSDFNTRFITPVVKEGNERSRQRLQQLIRPFILRRTKEQVAPELPPLTEEVIYCEMTDEQMDIYVKEKNTLRNSLLDEWQKNKIVALNGITRLRQLANHPRMVLPEYTGSSGKIEEVTEAYETLMSEGHKVLIFSSFVTHLKLLAEAFDNRSWRYAMLTGSTADRDSEIARFAHEKDVSAFFISLKAGGVGLNLTEADYVFILDPWWNPAAEMQAESRAHRIGQDKQVFVYRFITSNTIEEKIRILQERKSELSSRFITENDPLEQLTDEEWKDLL